MMSYQNKTGPLMAHSTNMCDGQDANNDMLVTEKRHANELGWHSNRTDIDAEQCERGTEDAR